MRRDKIIGMIYDNARIGDDVFDFPEYGGLPERISDELTSEFVDAVQNCWENTITFGEPTIYKLKGMTRRKWISEVIAELKRLGEPTNLYGHL